MAKYCYSQLSLPTSIRLLRLPPSEKDVKSLRCELFEYPLRNSDKPYPYEALSYVWGSEEKPQSISIDNRNLNITQNLYTALLHLRDHGCSRAIWVDAVCINQDNEKEKEEQIPLMAEIYAKARRVVVWLGEAENGSHHALEAIRLTCEKSKELSNANMFQQEILKLLQRPWFRRIWVLQEMAAARHVLIMCGSTEIDGHAFCLGLESLGTASEDVTTQVTFLIRGAIFRSRHVSQKRGRLSLGICSLGELIDMYHAHKATKRHDKVYALLGMCSDDLSAAGLEPDYSLPWKVLMKRVVKFLLGDYVSIETWNETEVAIIKSKGCVLGKVSRIGINNGSEGGQNVEATINTSSGCKINGDALWLLRTSAKSIREGDLICLLQGASLPTIIRSREDHFTIVVIAPVHLKHTEDGDVEWSKLAQSASLTRDFLLVWDWKTSLHNQDPGPYDTLMRANDLQSQHAKTELEIDMDNAIRKWDAAQILGDGEGGRDLGEANKKRKKAEELFQVAVGKEHTHSLECQCSQVPLLWAAGNGESVVVDLLLAIGDVDPELKDYLGRTPLSLATERGHEAVVKLLLETGKVEVNAKDISGQTPLSWAARSGHEAVVKLLLETGKVEVDTKDNSGWTPLSCATGRGYEAVVKLLLETGKVEVDAKDSRGWTPLLWAAWSGYEAIVKLLLETGKVEVNVKNSYGLTPLSWAARGGHEAVVKLLLETGKVEVDTKDRQVGRTPLLWAVEGGREAVVKLLLETGKVEVNAKDSRGWTPLSLAAEGGYGAVVKLLLETGKVEVDAKDSRGRTPLSRAAERGHAAVVKLLLETGKVEVDAKDNYGRTPLSLAVERGHEAVVKLLQLSTE